MAIFLHQFDQTAAASTNKVLAEPHILANGTAKLFTVTAGLFYTKSLSIKKNSNNTLIRRNIDYRLHGFDAEITALTGYECAAAIEIINPAISGQINITYQAVGGKEGETSSFIQELRQQIAALGSTVATWSDVKDKPQKYPAELHTHNILTDLTGLASINLILERLFQGIADIKVPVLSSKALSARIDRLLYLIANQRAEITKLALMVTPSAIALNEAVGYYQLRGETATHMHLVVITKEHLINAQNAYSVGDTEYLFEVNSNYDQGHIHTVSIIYSYDSGSFNVGQISTAGDTVHTATAVRVTVSV